MKKIIGGLMLAAVVALFATLSVQAQGWPQAVLIWIALALMTAWCVAAVWLLFGD